MDSKWHWTMIATTAAFHCSAMVWTLLRLWYRWSTALMWWDDIWAVAALLTDATSLIFIVLEQSTVPDASRHYMTTTSQWCGIFAFSSFMWATRLSVLTFMLRVSQPPPAFKRIALCISFAFGVMWIDAIARRLEACAFRSCAVTGATATAPTIPDDLGDALLVVLSAMFLYATQSNRERDVVLFATASASMVIYVLAVIHATLPSELDPSVPAIMAHIKAALSLIACNVLVTIALLHRTGERDPEACGVERTRTGSLVKTGRNKEALPLLSAATRPSTWSFTFQTGV